MAKDLQAIRAAFLAKQAEKSNSEEVTEVAKSQEVAEIAKEIEQATNERTAKTDMLGEVKEPKKIFRKDKIEATAKEVEVAMLEAIKKNRSVNADEVTKEEIDATTNIDKPAKSFKHAGKIAIIASIVFWVAVVFWQLGQ